MRPPPGPYGSLWRTVLATLCIGSVFLAPIVLWQTVGGPVPDSTLTERISADGVTGTRRVPGAFLVEFLGILLWLAAVVVLFALALEIVGTVRARTPPVIEALRPLQQFHRGELAQLKQSVGLRRRNRPVPSLDELLARTDVPTFAAPPEDAEASPVIDGRSYEVSGFYTADGVRLERETFWSIARDQLGDPLRWRQVAEANRALLRHHGRSVQDPGWPEEGWILFLPGGEHD